MRHTAPTLMALLAVTVSVSPLSDTRTDTTGLDTAEEITETVEKSITSALCTAVKQLLQLDYNQTSRPDLSELTLNLYTREDHIVYDLSDAAEVIPTSPWFKNQSQIIIYMHGFLNDPTQDTFQDVNDAFLEQGDYNLLALDSSSLLGMSTLYLGATTNVRYIGEKLGAVLANMTRVGWNASSMYLIGHSLGAHIAGFTGKTFYNLTGSRVGRITGLDPAGPCYTDIDSELKLDSTDADFVDVIHTDVGAFGLDEQIGHTDFYPNSGSKQTGCHSESCDHNRAWKLFAESVTEQTMPGVGCNSWDDFKLGNCNTSDISVMGFVCDPSTRGRYYLQTNGSSPYGRGVEGLIYAE